MLNYEFYIEFSACKDSFFLFVAQKNMESRNMLRSSTKIIQTHRTTAKNSLPFQQG
jgi:hypothetical protein